MKTSMWIVVVIVALFTGFLFGYAISVRTGIKAPAQATPGHPGYGAPAGGYGSPAGGYGAPAGGYGAPKTGGYGAPTGGYGTPKPKTGGYGAPSGGYGR